MPIKRNMTFPGNTVNSLAIISLFVLSALFYYHCSYPDFEKDSRFIMGKIYPRIEKIMYSGKPSGIKEILDNFRSEYSIQSIRIIGNDGRIISSSGTDTPGTTSSAAEQMAGLHGHDFLQIFNQDGPSVVVARPIRNGATCRRCHATDAQTLGIISMTFSRDIPGFLPVKNGRYLIPAVSAVFILAFFFCSSSMVFARKRKFIDEAQTVARRETTNENGNGGSATLAGPLPVEKNLVSFQKKKNAVPEYFAKRFSQAGHRTRKNWSCEIEPGHTGGPLAASEPLRGTFDARKIPIGLIAEGLDEKNLSLVKTLQRLSAVHKVALTTNSTMELDKVFHNLLDVTMKALTSEIGYILLFDGDRGTFQVHTVLDHAGNPVKVPEIPLSPESVSTWVFNSRKPMLIRNIGDYAQFSRQSQLGHERKSLVCVPLTIRNEIIGTMSVVNKIDDSMYTPEDLELLTTIASQASFAMKNAKLYEEQQKIYMNIIHALVSIIDASDSYTRGHSERVTIYSLELARKINLRGGRLDIVERAAILHDIGKIGINASLLNKEKILSNKEIFKLRQHPLTGMKILEPLDFLGDVSICVGQHHERFDGMGYPFGIPGEKLLIESRILAIADAFDAMTSNRPYRKALSPEKALREITDNAGKQHDPVLVRHFAHLVESGNLDHLISHADSACAQIHEAPKFLYGSVRSA